MVKKLIFVSSVHLLLMSFLCIFVFYTLSPFKYLLFFLYWEKIVSQRQQGRVLRWVQRREEVGLFQVNQCMSPTFLSQPSSSSTLSSSHQSPTAIARFDILLSSLLVGCFNTPHTHTHLKKSDFSAYDNFFQ